MMKALSFTKASRATLVRSLETAVVAAFTALVASVLWGVLSRYLLGGQSRWTEELSRVLLVWISLMGGALAYGQKAHLGVDYLTERMDQQSRRYMKIFVDCIVLAFAVFVLLIGGWQLASETFAMKQMMMAIGIPKGFVYASVPLAGLFFCIFSAESIIETLSLSNTKRQNKELSKEGIDV